MSGGGGSTNTVTSNSQPPPQFQQALGNLGQQAIQTAQTPYQPYTGNLVAPLSPDQQQGIAGVQGLQGISAPYINAAAQEIGNSTTPLQPYIQPYIDQAANISNLSAANAAWLPQSAQPGINQANNLYSSSATNAAGLPASVQGAIGNANGLYNASATQLNPTQFSAGQVAQYESPYTQQVVNATQAQFNNQNQQQQQGVKGNAISQGAFGGDREAVAEGITAGQQQLAQAPVIAGLENQGYSQALNEFNTQQQVGLGAQQATQQLQQGAASGILAGSNQNLAAQQASIQGLQSAGAGILSGNQQYLGAQQAGIQGLQGAASGNLAAGQAGLGANEANAWLASQAGFGLSNLGNQALNNGLQESNALLSTGGLEQQQAQQALNIPYEQYTAAQAYPFQTESWLSGLEGQLANAAGGTASTTSPGASPISQIAGLGLTGVAGYNALTNAGLLGGSSGTAAGLAAAAAYAPSAYAAEAAGAAGAAGIASGVGQYAGLLAAAKRGGAIPERAEGGGIVAFPIHRARSGVGRGITSGANDNMDPMPIPKRAAGGVTIPQLPTSGGGIVNISSHGGVSVPQLPTSGSHGAPSSGPGTAGINSYLADTAAGASHQMPTMAPLNFSPPPSAPSTSDLPPGAIFEPNPYAGNMRRGGGIMRRDDGGPIMDLSATDRDDGSGGIGGAGPLTIPGEDQDMPIPPIPPRRGIMAPPPAMTGDAVSGASPADNTPILNGDTGAGAHGTKDTHVPWETLLAAGLSIMGGSSPNALTNIGRGGMQGLQFGEQQRVREENAALRKLQLQDLAAYRQGQIANTANRVDQYGRRVDILGQEANTHATAIQNTDAYRQAVIANRNAGLDEKTANDKALQDIRQQRADTALYGTFARTQNQQRTGDQRDRALDQSDQRINQGAERIAASQEAQQARLALTQRGQDSTSANADINAAARMVSSGMVPDFPTALQRVQAGRATQGRQPTAAGASATPVADPLGIR